jgi:hypothetical protein
MESGETPTPFRVASETLTMPYSASARIANSR